MASINGIEIKNLKTFKDHEGCDIAQGNIYYNGKKLGFLSQDYMSGPDSYDFDEKILDAEVAKYRNSSFVEEKYKDGANLDCLLGDLLKLADSEKEYKRGKRKGYTTYVEATDGWHVCGYYTCAKDVFSDPYHEGFVKECKAEFFKNMPMTVKVYNDIKDFALVV